MSHSSSDEDRRFRDGFESGGIAPAGFDHRAHVRLAYVYLVENDVEAATGRMRDALHGFLRRNGIPESKYHETMTRAWILAVRHFMARTPPVASADAFIGTNPVLLDAKIMLTHYSAGRLFSDEGRAGFVDPDLQDIPRHDRGRR